jgi:hypothetical protein
VTAFSLLTLDVHRELLSTCSFSLESSSLVSRTLAAIFRQHTATSQHATATFPAPTR